MQPNNATENIHMYIIQFQYKITLAHFTERIENIQSWISEFGRD